MNLAVNAVSYVIQGTEEVLRFEVMRSIECLTEWNQELVLVLLGDTTGCLREWRGVPVVCLLDNRAPHGPKMIHEGVTGT
jgi:hypothetical protein